MKKGDTIEAFLQGCLGDLRKEFHELRGVTSEGPWLHYKPTAPWTPLNSTVDCTVDNAPESLQSISIRVLKNARALSRLYTGEYLRSRGRLLGSICLRVCSFLTYYDGCRMVAVRQTGLIYIKEDLIIPSNKTFYDFIVTKARGKSGPLFDFGVNDDVRLLGGANVETEESHAGKVILRYVLLRCHSYTVCDCTIAAPGGASLLPLFLPPPNRPSA